MQIASYLAYYKHVAPNKHLGIFMKQFIKLMAAVVVLAGSTLANAAVIKSPLTQTITPSSPFLVTTTNSFTHTFDFTGVSDGYVPGTDTIEEAWLSVLLNDDGGSETYKFLLNTHTFVSDTNTPSSELYNRLSITGTPLANLNGSGQLKLTISASEGSFKVVSSTLDATMARTVADPVQVPEPLSVALFGLGLAGMAAARRQYKAK
jgi:hypothetical protein